MVRNSQISGLAPFANRIELARPSVIEEIEGTIIGLQQRHIWNALEKHSDTIAPVPAESTEVGIAFPEALTRRCSQAVALDADQVDRHSYGEIAAHGRVKRNQNAFHGVAQVGLSSYDAVENGFAVFGFTGLKVRGLRSCFDEITFGEGSK